MNMNMTYCGCVLVWLAAALEAQLKVGVWWRGGVRGGVEGGLGFQLSCVCVCLCLLLGGVVSSPYKQCQCVHVCSCMTREQQVMCCAASILTCTNCHTRRTHTTHSCVPPHHITPHYTPTHQHNRLTKASWRGCRRPQQPRAAGWSHSSRSWLDCRTSWQQQRCVGCV